MDDVVALVDRAVAATSAALTDAVGDDWRARDWHEDTDAKGGTDITLVLASADRRVTMSVRSATGR